MSRVTVQHQHVFVRTSLTDTGGPKPPPVAPDTRHPTPDTRHQASSPINKDTKKELQKQQKIFQQLEEKIAVLNKQKNELQASLVEPATYSDKAKFLHAESAYKTVEDELKQLNLQYEVAFEKIIKLEANQGL